MQQRELFSTKEPELYDIPAQFLCGCMVWVKGIPGKDWAKIKALCPACQVKKDRRAVKAALSLSQNFLSSSFNASVLEEHHAL